MRKRKRKMWYPVDYVRLDAAKEMAQWLGKTTVGNLARFGFSEAFPDRSESAHIIDCGPWYQAAVLECQGTRMLIADAWYKLTGISRYGDIGESTVAVIDNDLAPYGAAPFDAQMLFAVGDARWFDDERRIHDLLTGWQQRWIRVGASWRQGETPELESMVMPGAAIVAGAAQGIIKPKERLIQGSPGKGDAIILLESSGIHDNGISLPRHLVDYRDGVWRKLGHLVCPWLVESDELLKGYLTLVNNDRLFGDMLLDATASYGPLIQALLDAGVAIHYAVHISGHGWLKLMRHPGSFLYVIERIPEVSPLFRFIQDHAGLTDEEMYSVYNMGAGFALYVSETDVALIRIIAGRHGIRAWHAGYVDYGKGKKNVIIRPLGITLPIRR